MFERGFESVKKAFDEVCRRESKKIKVSDEATTISLLMSLVIRKYSLELILGVPRNATREKSDEFNF